jgi:hypothetical protein
MTVSRLKVSLGASLGLVWFAAAQQIAGAEAGITSTTNTWCVPRLFRADGKLTHEAFNFTTKAYEREALRLVLQEANNVAKELQLPEKLPVTESNLSRAFIVGYGMSLMHPKMIGNVHTKDYGYFVSVGHKLSYVEGAHQDEDCLRWMEEYRWPKNRMDTKGAYQLATQWLAAARMDVAALNRECRVRIEPDPFANRSPGREKFVPIYYVYWQSAQNRTEGYGSVASVKLFYPTKTLISLRVEDPKYILRPALVFTNLAAVLSEPLK